jgi:membrane protein YqaA with SNARE-associated domain
MVEFWQALPPDALMFGGLAFLFLVSFLGSTFLPLPVTVTIVWLGQFHFPVWVVLVGTLRTMLGWVVMERFFRNWLIRRPEMANRIPASYQRFFLRHTGFWLFFFNALPFPIDFMRLLALLNGYPSGRMMLILTAGRLVRNVLLVSLGMAAFQHQEIFWSLLIMLLLLPPLAERLMRLKSEPKLQPPTS